SAAATVANKPSARTLAAVRSIGFTSFMMTGGLEILVGRSLQRLQIRNEVCELLRRQVAGQAVGHCRFVESFSGVDFWGLQFVLTPGLIADQAGRRAFADDEANVDFLVSHRELVGLEALRELGARLQNRLNQLLGLRSLADVNEMRALG